MQARSFANDADIETLEKLNGGYMKSVQSSDVRWFENNLAEDFLNSNPDGSLVDRAGFLEQIARPATLSNFEARDVRIRIMGDIAIIHGRTTYTKADGCGPVHRCLGAPGGTMAVRGGPCHPWMSLGPVRRWKR